MGIRDNLDISAYLVVGPENVPGGAAADVAEVVYQAVSAGFTCVQVRSKECSARELISCTQAAADAIARAGAADHVALLVDDRLDVALAAREMGVRVSGVHVGQSDIPPEVCRRLLGEDAVVGLSARTYEMRVYLETADVSGIDYFGIGPLNETATKPDCGMDASGQVITRSLADLADFAHVSPLPIVVGGGVKLADIAPLAATGVDGFFVVSAVCAADDPRAAAAALAGAWRAATR